MATLTEQIRQRRETARRRRALTRALHQAPSQSMRRELYEIIARQ
jgi:hypothetical protein